MLYVNVKQYFHEIKVAHVQVEFHHLSYAITLHIHIHGSTLRYVPEEDGVLQSAAGMAETISDVFL